ncbi:LysR family transcriptional regulator [Bacillus pseudomycoides]|uniref:HTH-type transcriptional regulator CzcR n=1 Tax=Bacillus pseudomycoides TaxID=64104 RepID=A0AA91VC68_9BACI|nr:MULTISPECIES: LysR family transcriptional regulator [Bacillus]PEB51753.1 LysR family transcriptional regulator [Bacillus sp. AFS098217]PED82402.1 LysR family transcriptional regulator [Bacillus pseudomycoides]PEU06420.1 LysR family transcriptional regulator [Bacillus sp. AFS019443]PEU18692.1 LysR family transcriptional regulator [Bacillus sp. AFS014408]PFW63939.1 LysR family transcriptional regulator [Bacillus sp. AFS075034]
MEINDLIIFKTVVNEGSISKAAKELGYVQPNVTERIKKLEQELETPLLHRYNKGISLLPSGDILLDYTNKILNLVEEAKNEIKMSGDSYRIATSQSILLNYLSTRIKENFRNYQIYMENSNHLQQLLKKQRVDMIITYGDYSDPAFQKVFSTTVSMGLLKAKGKSNIDYSKEFFFVSHDKQCPFRNYTIEFMKENNLSKKQLQQLDSYSLIQEFIAQGKGLAFLPINNDKLEKIEEVPIQKIPINFFTIRESEKIIPSELFD